MLQESTEEVSLHSYSDLVLFPKFVLLVSSGDVMDPVVSAGTAPLCPYTHKMYVCLHSSCLLWILLTAFLRMQLEVTYER